MKAPTIKLDQKDKKLIYELDIDSKQSASSLAKQIGISKQGCTLKINNLQKKGVIKSFLTVINTPVIGDLSFRMYFKLIDMSPEKEKEFVNYFINHTSVPWVVATEGLWDYVIVVFPHTFEDFEKFSTALNNKYGSFVEKKEIALVTKAMHFRAGYMLGKKRDLRPFIYAGQPKNVAKLDILDKQILTILAINSRTPIINIARELKTNAKNISYRIDKLKKENVIEGYTITVDLEKIGFERYKVFIRTKNTNNETEKKFIEYSRMHPYILYYSTSIGVNDVELELVVKNNTHLREVIDELKINFHHIIKSYEIMKIYKEYKLNYYPEGKK
ncbi:MAG: Lrp/AsnC family transcriptional regulator [Candidatus Woesearchaeota archaeon]|jgi:DNA-binding Lrp family transcriptional regulator